MKRYEWTINEGTTTEYIIIPYQVLEDNRLTEKNKIAFLLLDDFKGEDDYCYFTNGELAEPLGYEGEYRRKWTSSAIKELKKYEYIEKGRGYAKTYINLHEYHKKGKYLKVPKILIQQVKKDKLTINELIFYLILLRTQTADILRKITHIRNFDNLDYKKKYKIDSVENRFNTISQYYNGNDRYLESKFEDMINSLSSKRIKIRGVWIPFIKATIKDIVVRGKKSKKVVYTCNILPTIDELHDIHIQELEDNYEPSEVPIIAPLKEDVQEEIEVNNSEVKENDTSIDENIEEVKEQEVVTTKDTRIVKIEGEKREITYKDMSDTFRNCFSKERFLFFPDETIIGWLTPEDNEEEEIYEDINQAW